MLVQLCCQTYQHQNMFSVIGIVVGRDVFGQPRHALPISATFGFDRNNCAVDPRHSGTRLGLEQRHEITVVCCADQAMRNDLAS